MFFVIEVIGFYLLVYLAGRVTQKTYLRLTAIFAMASVATLLIIVDVLSFMLWPSNPAWYETGSVTQAFFGPNTFAQMFARLFFMLMISGVVGGMVAGAAKDTHEKALIGRALAAIGIFGAVMGAASFMWYVNTLPEGAHLLLSTRIPEHLPHMMYATTAAAVATVLLLVFGLAPEELLRETVRKPWIARQYIYSNQIVGRDVPGLGIQNELAIVEEKGILATHPFVPEGLRTVTEANRLEAGRALALTLCSYCHSLSATGMRPLPKLFPKNADVNDVADYLGARTLSRTHGLHTCRRCRCRKANGGRSVSYTHLTLPTKLEV